MRNPSLRLCRLIRPVVVVMLLLTARAAAGVVPEPVSADALFRTTCEHVLQGHFAEAYELVAKTPDEDIADARIRQLKTWLHDYVELDNRRTASRRKDFERHVRFARNLIEELGDPAYPAWIRRVYRTYATVFDHSGEEELPDKDQREAEFTAAVEACLPLVEAGPRRERYRRWAATDFERYHEAVLDKRITPAVHRRITPGLRGLIFGVYDWAITLGARQRIQAEPAKPVDTWLERVRQLPTTLDPEVMTAAHYRVVRDVAQLFALRTDGQTALLANLTAEILTGLRHRLALSRYVDQLYAYTDVVSDTQLAMVHADDENAFRAESWVQEMTEAAADRAQAYMDQGEWFRAASLFGRLENLHPKESRFREKSRACMNHVRVERYYHPKTHEWKEQLRGVDLHMAKDALEQVEQSYVVNADMIAVAREGLEAVLLLVRTDSLVETFHSLENQADRDQFEARTDELIKKLKRLRRRRPLRPDQALDRVLTINRETLKLPEHVVINEFMQGAFDPLDRFTSMIWPAEIADFNKKTMGNFSGVGIQITVSKSGELTVVSPLPDTPAFEAGIAPGDVITKVDGQTTRKMTINDAVRKITGREGTTVVLTVRSSDAKAVERDLTIKRARIEIKTVKGDHRGELGGWSHFVDEDNKIAYIRITSFMKKTIPDLKEALQVLSDQDLRGLILDLRFNPGGLLEAAVGMSDLFLPNGRTIVSTKGRKPRRSNRPAKARSERLFRIDPEVAASDDLDRKRLPIGLRRSFREHRMPLSDQAVLSVERRGSHWTITDQDRTYDIRRQDNGMQVYGDQFADLALIILVNDYSASASEIVAGALQDNHRALIIGQRTFGKGSVQNLIPVGDGRGRIKLTTARYYLPSGRLVHREDGADTWGVDPDIEVRIVPREVRKVIALQRKAEVLRGKNRDHESPVKEDAAHGNDDDALLDVDPQQEAALLVMRTRLLYNQPWPVTARLDKAAAAAPEAAIK